MDTIYDRFVIDLSDMARAWDCYEITIVGMEHLDFQRLQDALCDKKMLIKLRFERAKPRPSLTPLVSEKH